MGAIFLDKNKIISSLALAGILTTSALGANVKAASTEYLKPVGVYKNLIQEESTIVPYVLRKPGEGVTVKDLKSEFKNGLESIGTETNVELLNDDKILGTGTKFKVGGITYTLVVYGDVDGDGIVTADDASSILRAYVGLEELAGIQKLAAATSGESEIIPDDASTLLQFYVTDEFNGVTPTKQEDKVAPTIEISGEGVEFDAEKKSYKKYVGNVEAFDLNTTIVKATDNYEGNITYKAEKVSDTTNEEKTIRTITYTVSDIAENKGTVTLELIKYSGPEITISGEKTIYVNKNANLAEKLPTIVVSDSVVEDIVPIIETVIKVDGEVVEGLTPETINPENDGTYVITYKVSAQGALETPKTKEEEFTVVIDNTAPIDTRVEYKDATGNNNGTDMIKGELTVTIYSDEPILKPEGWDISEDKMSITKKYNKNTVSAEMPDGESVVIEDLAGNTKTEYVKISNLDNEISGLKVAYSNITIAADSGEETITPTNQAVEVTISAEEEISIVGDATNWTTTTSADGKTTITNNQFVENGEYTVTIEDKLGNTETLTINIRGIDKESPVAGVAFSTEEKTNENVIVTLTAKEDLDKDKIKIATDEAMTSEVTNNIAEVLTDVTETNTIKIEFKESGTYYVTITDLAGNISTPIKIDVTNIDKTAPNAQKIVYTVNGTEYEINNDTELAMTNKDITVTITFDEEVQKPDDWTLSTDKKSISKLIGEKGQYQVTVSDIAGNAIENPVTFTVTNIDKDAPIIKDAVTNEELVEGAYKNVTIVFNEGTALLKKPDGTVVAINSSYDLGENDKSEDGEYELSVTDAATNTKTVTFTIDNEAPVYNDLKEGETAELTDLLLKKGASLLAVIAEDSVDSEEITAEISAITYKEAEGGTEETIADPDASKVITDGTKDGIYTITYTVSDNAGNTATATRKVVVDGTPATYKAEITSETEEAREKTVLLTFSEEMKVDNSIADWTVVENSNNTQFYKTYTANTSASVAFKDLAGNTTKVEFKIDNIDRNAPQVIDTTFSPEDRETPTKSVTVTIKLNKEVELLAGWDLTGPDEDGNYTMSKEYTANVDSIEISDKLGNKTVVDLNITNIDTDVPTLSSVVYKVGNEVVEETALNAMKTKENITVTMTYNEPIIAPAGWTVLDSDENSIVKEYKENDTEGVIVTDIAGNESAEETITISSIDKEAPVVKTDAAKLEARAYKDVDISFEDTSKVKYTLYNNAGAEIKAEEAFAVASGIDHIALPGTIDGDAYSDGAYRLVVIDEAGNKTDIVFNIDTKAPSFENIEANKRYQAVTPTFTDGPAVLTDKDGNVIEANVTSGTTLDGTKYADGEYTLTVTDAAGNTQTVTFTIDNSGPKLTNISDTAKEFGAEITPTLETGETYTTVKLEKKDENGVYQEDTTYVANADNTTLNEISVNGEYKLTLIDDLGNKSEYEFKVDTETPVIKAFVTVGEERKEVVLEDASEYQKVELTLSEGDTLVKIEEDSSETPVENKATIGNVDGTEDGTYKVTVKRTVGGTELSTERTFVIDNVAPVVNVTAETNNTSVAEFEDGGKYQSVTPESDEAAPTIELYKKENEEYVLDSSYSDLAEINTDGEYKLVVSDKAGNKSEVVFTIDATVAATVSYSNNGSATNTFVKATISSDEPITAEGWNTVEENPNAIEKIYQADKTETVTITDALGNTNSVNVEVTGIDKTAPTASASYEYYEKEGEIATAVDGKYYLPVGGFVKATVIASEEVQEIEGWTLSDDKLKLTKNFTANTEEPEEVSIKDIAGNVIETPVQVTVDCLYETLPTITGMEKEEVITVNKSATTKYNLPTTVQATDCKGAIVNVVRVVERVDNEGNSLGTVEVTNNELETTTVQTYQITYTATDKAGNEKTAIRIINVVV